jgi:phenylacetic acid degradation operon negative regulatory protein
MIGVSNLRNTYLDIRPFNARSLALSALLGTHPPRLPAHAFVAFADLFEISGGTMRTALSRMVTNGEVVRDDSRYLLAGRLLDRQRAQDAGRHSPTTAWDDRWHTIVSAGDQRQIAERRRFRSVMANHRFGELRPDIWMRPANLERPPADPEWICTSGELDDATPQALVGRLWDLDGLAAAAQTFLRRLDQLSTDTDWSDERSIPAVFTFSAAVLRFLRNDPLLPGRLAPDDWPLDELRSGYDRFERSTQTLLRSFLAAA